MAKKTKSDRSDPRKNKSLAVRLVLKKRPQAKASEVVQAVQEEFGHKISQNMVYMVKTKSNMRTDGRVANPNGGESAGARMDSAAKWIEAIRLGKQLLKATGSVANATAILKAVAR